MVRKNEKEAILLLLYPDPYSSGEMKAHLGKILLS